MAWQSCLMASEPVFWGRMRITWSPGGDYIMRFPLWVEERALHECENELKQAIEDALEDTTVIAIESEPMVVTRTEGSTNAEPGELEIVTLGMIDPDEAVEMKRAVTPLLQSAIEATDRLIEADNEAAEALREALRPRST